MEKELRLQEISQLEKELRDERREIERYYEQKRCQDLLTSGDLQSTVWELGGSRTNLMATGEDKEKFDKYFTDTSFSSYLSLSDDVELFANFDDQDYFLIFPSMEDLLIFSKENKLRVNTAALKRTIEDLVIQAGELATIVALFNDE